MYHMYHMYHISNFKYMYHVNGTGFLKKLIN